MATLLNDYECVIGGDLKVNTIIEGGHWIKVYGTATYRDFYHSHCEVRDKNGELTPNLADAELMDDIEDRPERYEGHSYRALIREVMDDEGFYNLPLTATFIRNGGTKFWN
jgi:hypothetical protein